MKSIAVLMLVVLSCECNVIKFEQSRVFSKVIQGLSMQDQAQKLIKDAMEEINNAPEIETNEVETASQDKPWFCHDLDCPAFTVIEDGKDYELREYVATNWVTTSMTGVSLDEASSKMFMKLFAYISGANEKHEKIAMTSPVIVRIIPGQGPACENNFTMSFFCVPDKEAPKPTAADVTLTSLPKLRAYVRSFGGWADEKTDIKEASELAASLPSTAKYVKDFYYYGGYDAPFTIFHRHNEIWFIAE